jgi:hypothetical protein
VSHELAMSTILAVSPRVYSRALADEVVLLDFGRGEYYGLDEVGALLWKTAEARRSIGDAVSAILARYDIDRVRVETDVLALAHELVGEGLIEVVGDNRTNT